MRPKLLSDWLLGESRSSPIGRLTVMQLDDEGVVDLHQDVPLHLGSDPVANWKTQKPPG